MRESILTFTWKGMSSDAFGIDVKQLPNIARPAQRDDVVTIPGRSGALHLQGTDHQVYEEMLVVCQCYLNYEESRAAGAAQILSWLTGEGIWTQSDRPGVYYRGHITDQIDMLPWVPGFEDRLFSIAIWLEPYAYAATDTSATLTEEGTVMNQGTAFCEPRITITAEGDFSITVNGTQIDVTAPTGETDSSVIIDSELMEALESDGTTFANSRVIMDEFPVLDVGENEISWTGDVTSVAIQERVRYL